MFFHLLWRVVQMPYIMLGRISCASLVKKPKHTVLNPPAIVSLFHDIILMHDVAEEMAVVQLDNKFVIDFGRKLFKPIPLVTAQSDVQRDYISAVLG